jgi:acyl carrier protein
MVPVPTTKLDLEQIVREQFEPYLPSKEGPLEELVIADAGLDSVGLVMVLTDLLMELNLDVADSRVKLREIQTVADVATLARTMLDGQQPATPY